ncbi:unnamed protein product [Leptosia nina]|uniref:Uncharacterized protein n=1 Tax=Leptosia nina TaxID=320188 RepID=A0AAV1J588_9NEOP
MRLVLEARASHANALTVYCRPFIKSCDLGRLLNLPNNVYGISIIGVRTSATTPYEYRHIERRRARATHFRRDGFAGIGAGASKELAKFGRRRARVNPFEYHFSVPTWEWTRDVGDCVQCQMLRCSAKRKLKTRGMFIAHNLIL